MYSTSYLLFQSLTAVALGDALGFPIQHEKRTNLFDDPSGKWSTIASLMCQLAPGPTTRRYQSRHW